MGLRRSWARTLIRLMNKLINNCGHWRVVVYDDFQFNKKKFSSHVKT
jgi:hypothetical protein